MPWAPRDFATTAAMLAVFIAAVILLLSPGPLAAAGPRQDSSKVPEITGPECSFWLDRNDDGKEDEPFDTGPDEYVTQETRVLNGCSFKLNAPEEATLIVESDLKDWGATVELKREPGAPEDFKMYPGRTEIPQIQGSMRIVINFYRGDTPRSSKPRTLANGYRHEVQVPDEFRLLGVMVVTPDGSKDRLERNVKSASGPYIQVRNKLDANGDDLPQWAAQLAWQWLEEGYPQTADSLIDGALGYGETGNRGSNWWMWLFLTTWAVIIISAIIVFISVSRTRHKDNEGGPSAIINPNM